MSVDVVVLGLASVVRPTSAAAVYAFLASRSPAPLLVAYIAAGMALSLTIGVGAVTIVHIDPPTPPVTGTGRAAADAVLGVLALGAAAHVGLRSPPDTGRAGRGRRPSARIHRRLSRPTLRSAALAGVATHLPGVLYLGALAAIVASLPGVVGGLLQVAFYNLLWYAVPLAALACWTWRPEATRHAAAWLTARVQAHKRRLVVLLFVLVGLYLIGRAVYQLTVR